MKRIWIVLWVLMFPTILLAQNILRYQNARGESHLCGPFPLKILEQDTLFKTWYSKSYATFNISQKKRQWTDKLKDVEVDIYLGTWCGDSKKWVPRFVKMWTVIGLRTDQLNFIALYGFVKGKYKQGPHGEEKGKDIHRVPTFIFKRGGKEIARIVESPHYHLEKDLAQIALGHPPTPKYRGASYMIALFKTKSMDDIKANQDTYLRKARRLVKTSGELNTLGYMFFSSHRMEEAVTTFFYNTRLYKNTPNVYDSYAEALAKLGKTEEAIANYEKVLSLDKNNIHAKEALKKLREK